MPKKVKMKTKSILKSGRIKFTGTGKVMATRSNKGHFKTTKSKRANRASRRMHEMKPCFVKMIRRLMPYGLGKKKKA
ncbi:MAG: 50S ribosomal protein L35 [Alphaproteobacteria bacterium]|nr:50S ribosomal protein L35 [Alphaproteobacteria bacterium]